MEWEEYLKEELKYYDEHPEYEDPLEAHTNGFAVLEIEYQEQQVSWIFSGRQWTVERLSTFLLHVLKIMYYKSMEIKDQFQISLTGSEYDLLCEVMSFAYSMDFEEHSDDELFNRTWDKISNADHNIQFEEVNS